MTGDDLEAYLRGLGYTVERVQGTDGAPYTIARNVEIMTGGLKGRRCDVGIGYVTSVPYAVPAAVHTRPALLPMAGGEPYGTQASPIGPDWQYWSRRFDRVPTPESLWVHVFTILNDDRWPA